MKYYLKKLIKLEHFKIWTCGSGGKAGEAGMENLNIDGFDPDDLNH